MFIGYLLVAECKKKDADAAIWSFDVSSKNNKQLGAADHVYFNENVFAMAEEKYKNYVAAVIGVQTAEAASAIQTAGAASSLSAIQTAGAASSSSAIETAGAASVEKTEEILLSSEKASKNKRLEMLFTSMEDLIDQVREEIECNDVTIKDLKVNTFPLESQWKQIQEIQETNYKIAQDGQYKNH